MHNRIPNVLFILAAYIIGGCGDGDWYSGYGEDIDVGFAVTSTPFPDGHDHTILLITCDELLTGRPVAFSPLLPVTPDHNHKVTVTVEQQQRIVQGERVVVQTMDNHPHNWPFHRGKSCI